MTTDDSSYIIHEDDCDATGPDTYPSVTFCIPTLNDGETVNRSLSSMRNLDYPDLEILVIDGHSTDETIEIAEEYADEILYDENNYGSACQKGFLNSESEIVGLFDGDIYFPDEDWLKDAVSYFGCAEDTSTVWPKNEAPPNSGLLTQLYFNHWQLIMDNRMQNESGYFGGGNALFSRDALEEIGGIDPSVHWGADFDWAKRLHEEGYRVVYLEDAIYHHTMRDWSQFYSKQFFGAETFSRKGFGLMGMTLADVMFEQYVLGLKGMIHGLIRERDFSWSLFPMYIFLRSLVYGYTFIQNRLRGGE